MMKKALSLLVLTVSALALLGAQNKAAPAPNGVDPFPQEARDGDKPYAIVEWVPADLPQGVLAGNASYEVETLPSSE